MQTPSLLRPLVRALFICAALVSALSARAQPRPMEIEDLFRLHRVSDPQISPDGRRVAYVVTDVVKAENRTNADIWVVSAEGGEPRQLTSSPKHDRHPRWSPDGKWIAFESARDGDFQIWLLPADGGEARKLTTLSTGAAQAVWSPDGKSIAFVSAVFPEFSDKPFKESDKLNQEKLAARDKSKVKARVFDKLLYRHWDSWVEDLRQHLFVVGINADGSAAGDPRDVTPGENDGVPTASTFSAGDEFAFSPDGRELVFCAPPLPIREQAWSTNQDLWSVNLATGERKQLTTNPAADGLPRFSPDGKYLAYHAQTVAGFEADRWQLWLLDRTSGERRSLTANWDHSVGSFAWSVDGKTIFIEAQEKASEVIWSLPVSGGEPTALVSGGVNGDVAASPDGRWLAFSHNLMSQPPEIFRLQLGEASPQPLTHTNADQLAKLTLPMPESVTVTGAGATPVQMWILKPPGFDAAKKYPLVFWVHGGPQGAWMDSWSTRWNPEVWAAQGYVIAMPNPHGSTGFGQKYTDEISRDWGGKPYEDLLACIGYVEKLPYVDATRMAAAGASYGGYMMNWFEGHLDKFRCIVVHDGVYNFSSMYGGTEEVWFADHEIGQPWSTPDFDKFSPHKYAANFKTPMLIIHNELDFRVPITEGQQLFTTLQRRGIPSKFLSFPDEGHWVLKPLNSELWHKTIFAWLADYLKK
jgi:dipeptidyl aminopeptidase/acylaminoacyl peptidase